MLLLGWFSMDWLDNGSGNWGGTNGIVMVLVSLPGILLLKALGVYALGALDWGSGWMLGITVMTNLAMAYGVGWVIRAVGMRKPQ